MLLAGFLLSIMMLFKKRQIRRSDLERAPPGGALRLVGVNVAMRAATAAGTPRASRAPWSFMQQMY